MLSFTVDSILSTTFKNKTLDATRISKDRFSKDQIRKDQIYDTSYKNTIDVARVSKDQLSKDRISENRTCDPLSTSRNKKAIDATTRISKDLIFEDQIYDRLSTSYNKKTMIDDSVRNNYDSVKKDQISGNYMNNNHLPTTRKDRMTEYGANFGYFEGLSHRRLFSCKTKSCKLSSEYDDMYQLELHQQQLRQHQEHNIDVSRYKVSKSLSISKYGTSVINHAHFGRVSVTLQNFELWDMFRKVGTEMVITKSGRYLIIV